MLRRLGGIWRNDDFARLWSAATISGFGSNITGLAFPFVAILTLHASALQVGVLSVAQTIPAFISGLFAGVWADRLPRRPMMIACDLIRALLLLSIPATAWTGNLSFLQLCFVAGCLSIANTVFDVADRSMLPSLVDRENLQEANRMLSAGQMAAEAGGFSAGGWLVQIVTGPGAMLIDAATFLWSAVTLRRIQRVEAPPKERGERDPILREIAAGLRFVAGNRNLVALGMSFFLMSFASRMYGSVFLIFVNRDLGFHPGVLGVLFATGGLFSLIGSLISGRATALFGVGPLLIGSLVLTSIGQGSVLLISSASAIAVVILLAQQTTDIAWMLYEITVLTVRQSITPDPWLGRVNGSFQTVEVGGAMLGALFGGWMGDVIGSRATLLGAAFVLCSALAPLVFSPVRQMRALADLTPAEPAFA